MRNAIIVGLTGQTGAGKSTVAGMLKKYGYKVIDADASAGMTAALEAARAAGGTVHGGEVVDFGGGAYRRPALVEMPAQRGPMLAETFAPILYVVGYTTLDEAIEETRENVVVGCGLVRGEHRRRNGASRGQLR